jgi:hypothetical protein
MRARDERGRWLPNHEVAADLILETAVKRAVEMLPTRRVRATWELAEAEKQAAALLDGPGVAA